MSYQNLSNSMVKDILDYLECPVSTPTLRYLNHLIFSYIRKVPWESVSRIVKRHATQDIKDCPRLPEEFWSDAMQSGYFLKSVVMNKVINGKVSLFFSDRKPFRLEHFNLMGREETMLQVEALPRTLADVFKMPEAKIASALIYIQEAHS